jgi:hypothetical protein
MNATAEASPAYAAAPAVPATRSIEGDPRRKSPMLATLLSVMPGLGQIYVGYYRHGFVNALVVGGLCTFMEPAPSTLVPLAAMFLAFFWMYNLVDAGRRALFYNEALAGRSGIALPDELGSPAFRGSIAGGIAIAFVGAVLLSNTRFGMSLEWVGEWWPAGLIILGAYLAGRAILDRTRPS